MRVTTLVVLAMGTYLIFTAPPVSAADEGFNIVTSPLPIKLTTAPGRTVTADLRIKNLNTKTENIKIGLMKFGATGSDGQPNIFDLTPKDTYASWVHFSPEIVKAESNVWKTIKMTINVPNDATLGYYLAVTYSRASDPTKNTGTNFRGAAATLVLLDVKTGSEKRSLEFVDFSVDHKLYEYLPVNFSVKVHNNGNIYLAPTGNIFIEKGGKPVTSIVFNEAGGSVLPQSNRVYHVPWKSGFPLYVDELKDDKPVLDDHGLPKQKLTWDFSQASRIRFGHYTARVIIVYDDGTRDVPLEATVSFWVIPWKLLLVALVIVALLGFAIFTFVRSFFRRARSGATKIKSKREKKPSRHDRT